MNVPIVEPHDTDHATYSPSGMSRIIIDHCPISIPLSYGIVEGKAKQHTLDGTTAHELSELYLDAKLENKPLPTKLDPKFDSEMKAAALDYTEAIYQAVSPYLGYQHMWWIETPVDIDRERDCWGTPDFLFVYKKPKTKELHAIIFDYKYGYLIVNSEGPNQWQLPTYALGAVLSIGNEHTYIHTVTCHIYQPRVEFEAPPVTYTRHQLLNDYLPKIQHTIDLIEGWKEEYGPDGKNYPPYLFDEYQRVGDHCQFCKARGRCKAYASAYTKDVKSKLTQLIVQNGPKVKEYTDINQGIEKGILSVEDLEFFALNASKITNFLRAIPGTTMSLMAKGTEFTDIKVIETSKKGKWIEDTKTLAKRLMKLGIEQPVEKVDKWISISAAKKLLGKNKAALDDLIVRAGVNYKIVPASHKAPAVKFGRDTLALLTSILQEEKENEDDED